MAVEHVSRSTPDAFGARILALADELARFSETADGLTCTYLSAAHRAVAGQLQAWMADAGMAASIDAVGNVVGRYAGIDAGRTLILASHYDTVRNAGKYDGRLGILVPLVVIDHLHRAEIRLPFSIEMIAFSEEEGARFAAPYIGSSAVAGRFDGRLLDRRDAAGVTMADAMRAAGLDPAAIPTLARRPESLLGYLEVHIEQGPVLLHEDLSVGIVTSIAGNVRLLITVTGEAGHAGTVPMGLRRDAATAAAEIVLAVERCCNKPTLVGTVGRIAVPDGAINVIPGRCELSLDVRAADDATRDAAVAQILAEIDGIAARRQVTVDTTEAMRMPAVPCSAAMQARLADAVGRAGLVPRYLASGAGHDTVMFDGVTDVGMLFVRCGNGGISHSPRETITAEDADVAARVVLDVLMNYRP
jgi:beta-ureidopropionase / N-carbamoyl-L-amino-acid hydrolase